MKDSTLQPDPASSGAAHGPDLVAVPVGGLGPSRIGALGGLIFTIGLIASTVAAGSPPSAGDPAGDIAAYFVQHQRAALTSVAFGVVAAAGYLGFAGILWRKLARRPSAALLPAAAGAQISMVAVWLAITAGLAGRADSQIDDGVIAALFAIGQKAFSLIDIGAAVFMAAAGMAVLATGTLPRWLGVLPLAVALAASANAVIGVTVNDGPFAPAGPVDTVASLGFLAWVISISVLMLRSPERFAPTAPYESPPAVLGPDSR